MASRESSVDLTERELSEEHETLIHALRQQVRSLQTERDQALAGLHFLTEALRRRGCCDHEHRNGSL